MPITPPPSISGQITPNGTAPYTQQYAFGQAIGHVLSWNPQCSPSMIQNFLNDGLREVVGRRLWYGNLTRGQILTSGYYSAGSIALTYGSTSVQGTNTNWTPTLSGLPITQLSLRVGYYAPIYNIIALDAVHQVLTLDMPWGNPSVTSTGYYLASMYFSIPNLKFFFSVRNLQLYYRINTNYSQAFVDNYDPSRLILMYPRLIATMPPDPSGNYQFEMWPASNVQTAYPWTGYIQPRNLVDDADNFPPFCRVDAVISYAIAQALMYRPKDNPNYSEQTAVILAQQKQKEFEMRINTAAQEDENLWRQDIVMAHEMQMPLIGPDGVFPGGAMIAAMTCVGSDSDCWG
jgi:hypothetical protein